ncbi:MAG TPA: hypothetical protein VM261_10480 [Kofleriaceae bacterium]|nr:hypothetical protein [Kofleriaceae bacterium]
MPARTDRTAELARLAAQRAAAEHPDTPLDELLATIATNDLTTLLLHAHRVRAHARTFRDLRDATERQPMTRASVADARRLHAFDAALFDIAAAHDAVALGPVSPLGSAACAGIDPNHALATLRLGEIAADPTAGLALEATRRRRSGTRTPIHLVASQRVLRMNPIGNIPGFSPHFQLAALASYQRASRAADDDALDRALLAAHVATWANLFAVLPARGFRVAPGSFRVVFADVRLTRAALLARGGDPDALARQAVVHKPGSTTDALAAANIDLPRAVPAADLAATVAALGLPRSAQSLAAALVAELAAPLADSHPDVPVAFDLARIQGLTYYAGPCLQLHIRHDDGRDFNLGDGGALAWLGALLDDRRERMVTTGIGAELLAKLF